MFKIKNLAAKDPTSVYDKKEDEVDESRNLTMHGLKRFSNTLLKNKLRVETNYIKRQAGWKLNEPSDNIVNRYDETQQIASRIIPQAFNKWINEYLQPKSKDILPKTPLKKEVLQNLDELDSTFFENIDEESFKAENPKKKVKREEEANKSLFNCSPVK